MFNPQNQQASHSVREKLSALGLPEKFRLTLDFPSKQHRLRRVLPFRRSWPVIAVIAAIDVAVMIPAVTTFGEVFSKWQKLDSLFELTTAVFLTAWAVGWSVAPLLLSLVLLLLLTGREVLIGRPGVLQLGIGVPGLLVSADFDTRKIANFRLTYPEKKSGTSWRGAHISFDYGDRQIDFGSAMTQHDLSLITGEIGAATQGVADTVFDAPVFDANPNLQTTSARISTDRMAAVVATPVSLISPSTLALIASNLVPLIGAFFFDWRLSELMVLYWSESAVIAVYNLAKMAYVEKWAVVFTGIFFLAHFSGFMAIHFLFIYNLFVEGPQHAGSGDLKEVANMFIALWPALVALVISHGVSFVMNFVGKQEYKRVTAKQLMSAPYNRIVLMQVTLIFGGFITLAFGDPVPVLLMFVLIKIIMDVRAHLKEHSLSGKTNRGLST